MECDKQILAGKLSKSVEAIKSFQKMVARKYILTISTAKSKTRKLSIINKLIPNRKYVTLLTGLYEMLLPGIFCCSRRRNQ